MHGLMREGRRESVLYSTHRSIANTYNVKGASSSRGEVAVRLAEHYAGKFTYDAPLIRTCGVTVTVEPLSDSTRV